MYAVYPYWYRAAFQPIWATSVNEALAMMAEAVQGERNDELFYDRLIKLAPNRTQADIITAIRDDERGHNTMFRAMYKDLTGTEVPAGSQEPEPKIKSYADGLEKALFGELAAVEKYRKIWFGLPQGVYKDTVQGIILDELKHAAKYNYLIAVNRK